MDQQNHNNPEPTKNSSSKFKPQFEIDWFLLKIKEVEPISFIIVLVTGIALMLSSYSFIASQSFFNVGTYNSPPPSKQYVKIYDNIKNSPEILEGSHYKLHPEEEYRIEIINPDRYEELVWKLIPSDFGEVDFNINLANSEKLFALYKTPQVPDGSSGIIEVCDLDQSGLCHSLNLPKIKIVISK